MYFQKIAAVSLTTLIMVYSAPVNNINNLKRRGDTCTITGYQSITQTVNYGIATAGTSGSGNLHLGCTNGKGWDSGRDLPVGQTIKASRSGLPEDVRWVPDYGIGGYSGCSASYRGGALVKGKTSNDLNEGVGIVSSGSTCEVTFDI